MSTFWSALGKTMLRLALILLVLLASPVLAASWTPYENARFGYTVDIPAGFAPEQEALNGDGLVFRSGDGRATLRVYGGNIVDGNFESALGAAMGFAEDAGWALSYKRVTPGWASYSGTRNGQILYARAIATCSGTQFASFELTYPRAQLADFDPVVEHMVGSLRDSAGADC